MTLLDCPRCHGKGWDHKGKPRPTMRVVNVMGTTQTIHYRCGECCYTEKKQYGIPPRGSDE
jgi:hypothetical protein